MSEMTLEQALSGLEKVADEIGGEYHYVASNIYAHVEVIRAHLAKAGKDVGAVDVGLLNEVVVSLRSCGLHYSLANDVEKLHAALAHPRRAGDNYAKKIRGSIIRRLESFHESNPSSWCGYLDDALGAAEVIAEEMERTAPMAPDGYELVSVVAEDANNYCRILTALGMEEEGDPVAEVERLMGLAESAPTGGQAGEVVVYTYQFDYETQSRYLLDGPVADGDKFVTIAAYEALASSGAHTRPMGVPDGWKLVESDALPPGYTLGCDKKDGSFWPLFESNYIDHAWYATKPEAEVAARRDAHARLTHYMDSVRRFAMLAAAPVAGESS